MRSSKRSPGKRAEKSLVSQLTAERDELREEVRQLRAALILWAKAAEGTCQKCAERQAEPEALVASRAALLELTETLQSLAAADPRPVLPLR